MIHNLNSRLRLEHRDAFDDLASALKGAAARHRNVYYLANPGNWGDGVIRHATLLFLRDLGIPFKELNIKRKLEWLPLLGRDNLLIYGGGGAWCRAWPFASDIVKKACLFSSEVVVLPSSYEFFLESEKVEYWRRDRFQSTKYNPSSRFCHDMAFYLGDLPSRPGYGTGVFLRTDRESGGDWDPPANNRDLSKEADSDSDVDAFFAALEPFERIITDRLHVSIVASLMGKRVDLIAGSYWKSKAIYESSMLGIKSRVSFHEEPSGLLATATVSV